MATRKLCAATLSGFSTVLSHPVRGKCLSGSIACRNGRSVASMVKKEKVSFVRLLERVLGIRYSVAVHVSQCSYLDQSGWWRRSWACRDTFMATSLTFKRGISLSIYLSPSVASEKKKTFARLYLTTAR
ncbi:hypothetical protein PCH_Pc12g01770 [Penicillium rubens Wisconsin 54-1255]|uniref:Uncharacterized protein n=1 Tax=Penicillium rubens (strain ATCC 28089 / DSM 1075 / NRRL 1951 / Wisconsin 54-1255) TaxID=500485 RepID=B6GZ50_PENRW|nr:hypothetical protein PCH_Pc12g01770 [Penicillium rubens Wisconsin 54-1255]